MEILRLTRSQLEDPEILELVYRRRATYYWSDDWSPAFYRQLARAGFICIAYVHDELGPVLIPEMQAAYAVLDWDDLHLSRTMRRWLRSSACLEADYALEVDHDLDAVLAGVARAHGEECWLGERYAALLHTLCEGSRDEDLEASPFAVMTPGLVSRRSGRLVAGEIGYRVGPVYTSLTGFFEQDAPNSGTLQLVKLAERLRDSDFAYWNLGHPGLAYKRTLGARVVERAEFLRRWSAEALTGSAGCPSRSVPGRRRG